MYCLDDTIAAIATPPGGAARGIVRLSGPQSIKCLTKLFLATDGLSLADRHFPCVVAGSLCLPNLLSPIPCDAYIWAGRNGAVTTQPVASYTGQTVVELHTIGSPPLLQMVLRAVCAAGARPANPGEFTLRAFLAGRIDLTQAEAVLGVIDARDSRELGIALTQLAGGVGAPLHRLRDALLDLLAHVEAGFDFADEDLPFITSEALLRQIDKAGEDLAAIARQMTSRGEASHIVRAVLTGRPNAGKSSLFNALIGQRGALVSEHPGTTRDYLTAEIDLDGVKCMLVDTAGMETEDAAESGTEIDRSAFSAADRQRRAADVLIHCLDSGCTLNKSDWNKLARSDLSHRILVLTKCDGPRGMECRVPAVETSARTGQGIGLLREELRRRLLAGASGDVVASTAVRCADSLRQAAESLSRAREAAAAGQEELVAAELRVSLQQLGEIVGAVYTDDVLDRIFSRFCVGK